VWSSTSGAGQTVNINYFQKDTNGVYAGLVNQFNGQNTGVHITYNSNAPQDTGQVLTLLTTMLRARGTAIGVFPMDIIWPPEFGANGWTVPLDEKWPASDRANYLPGPLAGCTYRGKMRDADIGCKVATRAFQHRLVLFAMLMASRLHFFRLSATLTHGRKVMAEGTFCHESGDRGPGS